MGKQIQIPKCLAHFFFSSNKRQQSFIVKTPTYMVACNSNLSNLRGRGQTEHHPEFGGNLFYIVCSRPVIATQREPVSKDKTEQTKTPERPSSTRCALVLHKYHMFSKKRLKFVEALRYFIKLKKERYNKIDSNNNHRLFEAIDTE